MKKKIKQNIIELLDRCDIVTLKAVYSALENIIEKGEAHERKNN